MRDMLNMAGLQIPSYLWLFLSACKRGIAKRAGRAIQGDCLLMNQAQEMTFQCGLQAVILHGRKWPVCFPSEECSPSLGDCSMDYNTCFIIKKQLSSIVRSSCVAW